MDVGRLPSFETAHQAPATKPLVSVFSRFARWPQHFEAASGAGLSRSLAAVVARVSAAWLDSGDGGLATLLL